MFAIRPKMSLFINHHCLPSVRRIFSAWRFGTEARACFPAALASTPVCPRELPYDFARRDKNLFAE